MTINCIAKTRKSTAMRNQILPNYIHLGVQEEGNRWLPLSSPRGLNQSATDWCYGKRKPTAPRPQRETVAYQHTMPSSRHKQNMASEPAQTWDVYFFKFNSSASKGASNFPTAFALFLFRHPDHTSYTSRNSKRRTYQHAPTLHTFQAQQLPWP
jgi:hypothetical protein